MLRLLGEKHDDQQAFEFKEKAKKLAKDKKIILMLENEIFNENSIDGIFGIEDKIISEYVRTIAAIYEIYPVLHRHKETNMLELYKNYSEIKDENFYKLENSLFPHLDQYVRYFIAFLKNVTEIDNPIANILKDLNLDKDSKLSDSKGTFLGYLSSRDTHLNLREQFINQMDYYNEILKQCALYIAKYVRENHSKYSDQIRNHNGLAENWIHNYFLFQYKLPQNDGVLCFDEAGVNLRNQIFYERLSNAILVSEGKDVWFIVGNRHLSGEDNTVRLENLFPNNSNISVIINDENAKKILILQKIYSLEGNLDVEKGLRRAAHQNNVDDMEWFISNGAGINAQDPQKLLTPLHLAYMKKNVESIKFLIEKGADTKVEDELGRIPSYYDRSFDGLKKGFFNST